MSISFTHLILLQIEEAAKQANAHDFVTGFEVKKFNGEDLADESYPSFQCVHRVDMIRW